MPVRPFVRALLVACLLTVAATARSAVPGEVVVRCEPDSLAANEEGAWTLSVRIANLSQFGIFGDSLLLAVQPLDQAAGGRAPVVLRLMLPPATQNLSAGDSLEVAISVAATSARARLEVRFHSHDGKGVAGMAAGSAIASGSVLDDLYPAQVVRVGRRDVELLKVPATDGPGWGAGVLVLPGEGLEARDLLAPAVRLAKLGLAVVIVNAPGRGRSGGADDFAGQESRAAALAALDTLSHQPGIDVTRLAVWGISRGGTLALRLALERPTAFRAVASQSASYDLWATYRASAAGPRAAIEADAGRDSAGWRERSPLLRAGAIKPAVLVLHGERDGVFPVAGAHAFAAAAKGGGANVVGRFLPLAGHELPAVEATRFLQSRLAPPQ